MTDTPQPDQRRPSPTVAAAIAEVQWRAAVMREIQELRADVAEISRAVLADPFGGQQPPNRYVTPDAALDRSTVTRAWALVRAAGRMSDRWAESDDIVKLSLWRNLHVAADELRDVLPEQSQHEQLQAEGWQYGGEVRPERIGWNAPMSGDPVLSPETVERILPAPPPPPPPAPPEGIDWHAGASHPVPETADAKWRASEDPDAHRDTAGPAHADLSPADIGDGTRTREQRGEIVGNPPAVPTTHPTGLESGPVPSAFADRQRMAAEHASPVGMPEPESTSPVDYEDEPF